ncbi:MAG: SiaC family regulatory phosphoprotein [Bacteroidales bacterium]|nr:SiaC family regulatory phosphoprotein [Bacteroidales bacterium]
MVNEFVKEDVLRPKFRIEKKKKSVSFEGQSGLANPELFYAQVTHRILGLIQNFDNKITINFKLEYINTSSSKWILHILKTLQAVKPDADILINWYYEEDDESIEEAGEVYQSLLRIPFNLIEIPD